jgi:antitoxin VapB
VKSEITVPPLMSGLQPKTPGSKQPLSTPSGDARPERNDCRLTVDPVRVYLPVDMSTTAKIFQHGGSQAVRLPREFRLPGSEVRVSRTDRGVLLEPMDSDWEGRRRAFVSLAGSCPGLQEVPPHASSDLPRDE